MAMKDQMIEFEENCKRINERLRGQREGDSIAAINVTSTLGDRKYYKNPPSIGSLPFRAGDTITRSEYESATGIKIGRMHHHLYAPEFGQIIKQIAAKYMIEWTLIAAHISHESGYTVDAVSSTGDFGICQILYSTARDYRLRVDEGVFWQKGWRIKNGQRKPIIREFPISLDPERDERLKPEKAIVIMAKKNAANFKEFGDWKIALPAYKRGTSGTRKLIKKSGVEAAYSSYYDKVWAKKLKIEKNFK